MTDAPPLDLLGIRHAYPGAAWSLEVDEFRLTGSGLVGLIGPNGAGKSTLLKIAGGVLAPSAGTVRLFGTPLPTIARREVARSLGYLPQTTVPSFDYSVRDVAGMGRYPHAPGGRAMTTDDISAVERALKATEMNALATRRLSRLSGGECKRAMLASVLAQEPRVMLLDEPTASLDIHHQVRLFGILRQLAKDGMAVLVVTHQINLASLFCSRVVFMREGQIIADGVPGDVLTPDRIDKVYGDSVRVMAHPDGERPLVIPSAGADTDDVAEGGPS